MLPVPSSNSARICARGAGPYWPKTRSSVTPPVILMFGAGDLTENLVEAGVVCRDGKGIVRVGDLSALWRFLRREQRKIWRCGGWCCGEGRCDLNRTAVGLGGRGRLCCQQRGERKAGGDEESDWRGALHAGIGRVMTKEVIRRQGVLTRPVYRELVTQGAVWSGEPSSQLRSGHYGGRVCTRLTLAYEES